MHNFGELGTTESASEELVESSRVAPIYKTLLLKLKLSFGKLTLKHTCSSLNLSQLQIVDQLG